MTSPLSTEHLQDELDSLYAQASVLGHSLLQMGRGGTNAWARSVAPQILHWAARGWVCVDDGHTIRRVTDPGPRTLRPEEHLLFQLLFTDKDDRTPRGTASFVPRYKHEQQVATWRHLDRPVRRATEEELRQAGCSWANLVSVRNRVRIAGFVTFYPGLSGTLATAAAAGAEMSPAAAVGTAFASGVGALVAAAAPTTDWFLTEKGRTLRDRSRSYADRLRQLLDRDDPLPPDQPSLTFYEQALALAMVHGIGWQWEERLREHHALDTTRSTVLGAPAVPELSSLGMTIAHTISPTRPPTVDSGGGGG
ncbi:hypothetical protein [Streptomyces peucetius]|nr:hypothetical protein CGZ69_29250 [Streptomyces peucetius subsp. caesius ATCC 27952]